MVTGVVSSRKMRPLSTPSRTWHVTRAIEPPPTGKTCSPDGVIAQKTTRRYVQPLRAAVFPERGVPDTGKARLVLPEGKRPHRAESGNCTPHYSLRPPECESQFPSCGPAL